MKKALILIFAVLMSSSFILPKKNEDIEILKSGAMTRPNGEAVKFEEVEIFSCKNIPQTRFLFNKKQNDVCQIAGKEDESFISSKLGGSYWGDNMVYFEKCPTTWSEQKTCRPGKLRKF